jgi:SAM-dependent methyltransferase
LVDTGVLAGHIDKSTGKIWGLEATSPPIQRARRLYAGQPGGFPEEPGLVALDIGAGNSRRVWEGYKTETLDIRKESGADYIQDTSMMTFRDNTFDLVASSHHLEHIGRLDQEMVWAEMFRVCKPGGGFEHIIPDVSWAADQISKGIMDDHVMNVLYGAQEAHGYAREFNLHYFGYTPEIGITLAKKAGFVDVNCKNWKDDPALGYNMILTGFKPEKEAEEKKGQSDVTAIQDAPRKRKKKK